MYYVFVCSLRVFVCNNGKIRYKCVKYLYISIYIYICMYKKEVIKCIGKRVNRTTFTNVAIVRNKRVNRTGKTKNVL